MRPTAKSLILDLLSTLRGGAMPVRALVAAGALFDVAENSIRVDLARLVARRIVERNERGQYRMAARAEAVQSRVVSWSRLDELVAPWSGGWIAVHTAALPRSDRTAVRRRARAFDLLGFRALEPGLWVRPDNLRGGVEEVRRQLTALGLAPTAPVFVLTHLDSATDRRARGLWDAAALRAGYRSTRRALAASGRSIRALTPERAMVETFLLGGQAIRQLVLDPLLPEPIVATRERRALIRAMRRYDQVGRGCWRQFMRTHDALSGRSPVNLRLAGGGAMTTARGAA